MFIRFHGGNRAPASAPALVARYQNLKNGKRRFERFGKYYNKTFQQNLVERQTKLEINQQNFAEGQIKLENSQQRLREQLIRMENEQGAKLNALFDAREVQFDINARITTTLNRIEDKLDRLLIGAPRKQAK